MARASIAVAGEALIDLVTSDGTNFVAHEGGGPMNVAIGAARLGLDSAFIGRVSSDAFGRKLAKHLLDNGVSDRLQAKAEEPTTLAVATLNASGAASYDFYTDGTADWQWKDSDLPADLGVLALHLGTLGMSVQPGAAVFERLAARVRDKVLITFDPNMRPAFADSHAAEVERIERQVGLCDVVKASDEDVRWLYPDKDPAEAIASWLELGPVVVVMTRGAGGARAMTATATADRPSPPTSVVDTVGAGDSFMAAFLAALADRDLLGGGETRARLAAVDATELDEILTFALTCASITCERPGADPPTRDDVAAAQKARSATTS